MGLETLSVPMRLFALNRERLCERLQALQDVPPSSIVLLEGGKQETRYCSDHEPLFRQVGICVVLYMSLILASFLCLVLASFPMSGSISSFSFLTSFTNS